MYHPPPEERPPSGLRAPPLTWSGGCTSERPRIPDRRTVRLALSRRFLSGSLLLGDPQAFEGAAGLRCPSPRQSFPAAGALHPGRGNFHRARSPALRSTERGASRLQRRLLQSLGTAASLPARLWGTKQAGVARLRRVAYIRPSSRLFCSPSLSLGLHIANLPIPPAAADRVQRGPAAAVAAAAASSIPRRMSGRAAQASPGAPWPRTGPEGLCTRSGGKRAGLPASPAVSALRGPEAEEAPAATALKRRPGGCCYPTPPYAGRL